MDSSFCVNPGQLRVRIKESVYSVELRHQEDSGESSDKGVGEEGMMERTSHRACDWLCAWSGRESLCVNVSRRLGDPGRGEIYARLSHSSHLLSTTGDCLYIIHNTLHDYKLYKICPSLSFYITSIRHLLDINSKLKDYTSSMSVAPLSAYRHTCQQQCPADLGPGWWWAVRLGGAAGWTWKSKSWVQWRKNRPASPTLGGPLQFASPSQSFTEKRPIKFHTSQRTLPGSRLLCQSVILYPACSHLIKDQLLCLCFNIFLPPVQVEREGLNTGLVLHMEEEKMVDILLNFGTKNSTAGLTVSLWQQMKQLKGMIPSSLQVHFFYRYTQRQN